MSVIILMAAGFPVHPAGNTGFRDWILAFRARIESIRPADITNSSLDTLASLLVGLRDELLAEFSLFSNRDTGTLFERRDYIPRELIRINKFEHLVSVLRQFGTQMAQGNVEITADNNVLISGRQLSDQSAMALLIDIPSMAAFTFTAKETISVVDIESVLGFCHNALNYVVTNEYFLPSPSPFLYTIVTAPLFIIARCLDEVLTLNASLFFGLMLSLDIMTDLMNCALLFRRINAHDALGLTIVVMAKYLDCSQAEDDFARLREDDNFKASWATFMHTVVEPIKRTNRASVRSILYFSRNLA